MRPFYINNLAVTANDDGNGAFDVKEKKKTCRTVLFQSIGNEIESNQNNKYNTKKKTKQ